MIVWGSGGKVVDCGPSRSEYCSVCERERRFNLILQYRYWGIYWIFNCVTEKSYMWLCDICSRGQELESAEVEAILGGSAVPFMHRFGCLVFIGAIGVFSIISGITGC